MQVKFSNSTKKGNLNNNLNKLANTASFRGSTSTLLSKAGDANQFLMHRFENGGFFLEFFCLDFIGLVCPRVWQAFNRNKEELGHLNFVAGIEELLREAITGPSMFFIPMAALAFAGTFLGKGSKINTKVLQKFTDVFKKSASKISSSDTAKISKEFSTELFNDLFAKHIENAGKIVGEAQDGISKYKETFLNLIEQSQGKLTKEQKKEITRNFADLISNMNTRYLNTPNTRSVSFLAQNNRDVSVDAYDLLDYIKKYTQDVVPTVKATVNELSDKTTTTIESSIVKVGQMRENGRRTLTLINVASLAGFLSILPKIYQRAKSNPALEGLKHEKGVNA